MTLRRFDIELRVDIRVSAKDLETAIARALQEMKDVGVGVAAYGEPVIDSVHVVDVRASLAGT